MSRGTRFGKRYIPGEQTKTSTGFQMLTSKVPRGAARDRGTYVPATSPNAALSKLEKRPFLKMLFCCLPENCHKGIWL